MSSFSMILGVYQPQTSASGTQMLRGRLQARWQTQLRTWLPVLACSMAFAVESTPYLGSDHTSAPLRRLAEMLCGYGVDAHWGLMHHLIRKTGHFMGYGIFSLVCFRGFWIALQSAALRLPRQLRAHGLAILATFLLASADEFHQSFLSNRTGQFSDVLLDCCGAAALGLALFLAMQAVELRRQAQAKASCRLEPAYAGAAA